MKGTADLAPTVTAQALEQLLNSIECLPNLPSPPHIATQIIELQKELDVDFGELIDTLAQDPALVLRILKTANSSAYSRRRKVSNLAQALLTLGHAATTTLALSFTLAEGLAKVGDSATNFNLDLYWRRSLMAGFSARSLGAACGSDRCEELFLAALLQDVGQMVIAMAEPDLYGDIADHLEDHELIVASETALIGVDHAWVGGWLLEGWNLPSLICTAVRQSHTLSLNDASHKNLETADSEGQTFYACVALSGLIADVMMSDPDDAMIADLTLNIRSALELEPDEIARLLDGIAEQVPEIELQFGVVVREPEELKEIMSRAHTLLTDVSLKLLQEISDLKTRASNLIEEKSTDSLTGLFSREKLDAELAEWVSRASSHQSPVALAFMDLDGFKLINDVFGHPAGDEILKNAGALLRRQVRDTDTLARYGGDEFVLLLAGESRKGAMIVCQRILKAFEQEVQTIGDEPVDVKISIGLATLDMIDNNTPEELVKAADLALLKAKELGKGQVVVFEDI